MIDAAAVLDFTLIGVFVLLGAGLLAAVIRLVLGPSLPDRVVALDLIAMVVIALILVDAILTKEPLFLRSAIALALVSFLGTISFALYLHRKGDDA